ncbi:MAG TPA: hypothetical protein VF787_26095 [Thermoanaerobaculia bacterium]
MRSFRGVVRGLAVVSMVVALSVPAEAAARLKDRSPRQKENPVVKLIKQLVVRTFGDGLTDPKP